MEILVISVAALAASGLTLFSGFGLGTLLMPIIALFFPIDIAIAITAVVHLANNIFKVWLVGRAADKKIVLRFGIPAVIFAFLGAWLLQQLSAADPIIEYMAFDKELAVLPVNLVVGLLILLFVILEFTPKFASLELGQQHMPVGGMLSGFFGGLSGHQGAFRSMFLLKAGLSKEAFIATGVIIAILVDIARMLVYGLDMSARYSDIDWMLVGIATVAAFLGAYFGKKLLNKVTIRSIQMLVSVLLVLIAIGLITGII